MSKILIKNGTVFDGKNVKEADVLIENDKVAGVGKGKYNCR